ncbi:tRNA (guanosine(37)-N1)-methyltransferase TrmD [bacterium]|nr:tRNA (guanosine(37)-N1)-methyltransferase TrmD [Candidatus Omnitrophota bacterium]MBU2528162.1 tRNA (guanosine(37)-N1)-methyltransferase TrmD [bacterium]MBU3929540.1 tRNA (guanosine(37)-N1)-methyltransferase TrmD [bacterium]MBU4123609.1 tRNA (guanosine(37)-N1)-methyltransferase TrmD [bacterium]
MKIDILTIFPEYFDGPLKSAMLGKALDRGLLEIRVTNIRDFTPDGKVDDSPFGGGAGMILKAEPVYKAAESVMAPGAEVIMLCPAGERFTQETAAALSGKEHIILINGRYEGIDERVAELLGARKISIGDFVLSGGEAASMVIIEAVTRLIPGFMGNPGSLRDESFIDGYVEYPQYTRPAEFMGLKVPEILLSGDHGKIEEYRKNKKRKVKA